MINYQLFQAAVPPLCGGDWLIKALQIAGLGPGWLHSIEEPWDRQPDGEVRLTLVRDPLHWLELYRMSKDSPAWLRFQFSRLSKQDSFEGIVRDYFQHHAGGITALFGLYKAHVIERFEDLPWSLDEFLESIGTPRSLRVLVTTIGKEGMRLKHPRWMRDEMRRSDPLLHELYDY